MRKSEIKENEILKRKIKEQLTLMAFFDVRDYISADAENESLRLDFEKLNGRVIEFIEDSKAGFKVKFTDRYKAIERLIELIEEEGSRDVTVRFME